MKKRYGMLYRVCPQLTIDYFGYLLHTMLLSPPDLVCLSMGLHVASILKWTVRCILYMANFESAGHIYPQLNILNLRYIRKSFVLLLHTKMLIYSQEKRVFTITDNVHNIRRNTINFIRSQFRTTFCNKGVYCDAPRLWNSLPADRKKKFTVQLKKENKKGISIPAHNLHQVFFLSPSVLSVF